MVNTEPAAWAQLPIPALQPIMATSVTSVEDSNAPSTMRTIKIKLFRRPRNTAFFTFFASAFNPFTAWGTEKNAEKASIAMPK